MCPDSPLSDEQRATAEHYGRHARLIAGPGTGKTLVLTHRAQLLVARADVSPNDVLILTFTRAAAAELRRRLRAALGPEADLPRISTLHSFALRQLLRNPEHARLPAPIRIADDYEQRWIIEEDLARILRLNVPQVQRLFHRLSNDWERLAVEAPGWEEEFEREHPRFVGAWREHRAIFGYALRSELVYQLKVSLEQQDVRIDRPVHLLVDEYQDLNACDQAIVHRLAAMGAEVYAAGDDDQSIYGFRFALPEGIRDFPERFEGAVSLSLRTCQRCSREILEAALFVAEQDPRRLPKVLVPREDAVGGEVHLLRFSDNREEARAVAEICQVLIHRHGLRPRDILILFRSDRGNAFSDPIRRELTGRGIPVTTKTDPLAPLNEQGRPGRVFVAVLRLIEDSTDSLAWRTLLMERENGIGADTLYRICEFARERGVRFHQALAEIGDAVGPRRRMLSDEVRAIGDLLAAIPRPEEGQDVNAWLEVVARVVIPEADPRAEVLSTVRALVGQAEIKSLDQLLRTLGASLGEFEQETPEDDVVSLMTMHQAKGLTATAVILVAAEDEYIPGRSLSGSEFDDARRLLYVSMTRARRFLYMTFCNHRYDGQTHTGSRPGQTARHPSRFLEGLPRVRISRWEHR